MTCHVRPSHRDSTVGVKLLFFQIIKTFKLNLPSALAILTYETKRVRHIKELFLIPYERSTVTKKMIIFYGGANICTVIIRK